MSAITIRNLPDDVHDNLRRMALAANVSVEALVRNLLAGATGVAEPAKVTGMSEVSLPWGVAAGPAHAGTQLWGALRGCVQVPPETDLTAPVEESWESAR